MIKFYFFVFNESTQFEAPDTLFKISRQKKILKFSGKTRLNARFADRVEKHTSHRYSVFSCCISTVENN